MNNNMHDPLNKNFENINPDTMFDAIASSNMAHTLSSIEGDRPLIYVNQAFLDETGYSHDEVIGKNCRFLQGDGTDPETVKKIRHALDHFEPIDIEILNYRKDGTPFLNRLRMSTVFDASGTPLAYMGLQSNVNTLVENVRVAQEKYKMESLGRLSANISHEIKNALQPIKLMLDNLQDASNMSPEQLEKSIAIATENMTIAENVVRDVLRFSEHSHTKKEQLLATELVNNTLRFAKSLLPRTASINTIIDESLDRSTTTHIYVHQNEILQIITNFVNNALDAMQNKGQLTFTASLKTYTASNTYQLKEGDYLALSLKDEGCGIDEKTLKSIFQPFFSTKPPGEGTGLGLAVCMKIAKDHHGIVAAENNPDQGTTFTLYLPVTKK